MPRSPRCCRGSPVSRRALVDHRFIQKTDNANLLASLTNALLVTSERDSKGAVFSNFPVGAQETEKFEQLTDGLNLAVVFGDQANEATKYYEDRVRCSDSRDSCCDSRSRQTRLLSRLQRDSTSCCAARSNCKQLD